MTATGESVAHVEYDFLRNMVNVYLGERLPNGRSAVIQHVALTLVEHPEGVAIDEPSMQLPEAAARALLDALARHFGGTSSAVALQRNLDDERKRVDRLIEHLATAATGSTRGTGR